MPFYDGSMRSVSRRRPPRHEVDLAISVDLEELAGRATYIGSPEHKSYLSPAGPPRLRADATKCDQDLHGDLDKLTAWLRNAIREGCVGGPWEGGFPRYVWVRQTGAWYTGRLVVSGLGQYKGYEVSEEELPKNIDACR